MKNILAFVPYGMWNMHNQVDALICAALKNRGCNITVVGCDSLFFNCPLTGGKTDRQICKNCYGSMHQLFSFFHLDVTPLSSLVKEGDYAIAEEWIETVSVSNYERAMFKNKSLGEWVAVAMHSFFLSGHLDLSKPNVANMYRAFLHNGALLTNIFERLLLSYKISHVVMYFPALSYFKVAYELCKIKNIPVLTHQGGLLPDNSFVFADTEALPSPDLDGQEISAWNKWRMLPLTKEECIQTKSFFNMMESSKTSSSSFMRAFNRFQSDHSRIRDSLRIPYHAKIIAFYGSCDWEIGMNKLISKTTFETQIEALYKLIEIFKNREEYLVIRTHPYTVGTSHVCTDFLEKLFDLNKKLPKNVRMIMPFEKLTSYSIMWHANTAISFGSTTTVENMIRGGHSYSLSINLYTKHDIGIEYINSVDDLELLIDKVANQPKVFDIERLRLLYRFICHRFYRINCVFKSIGLSDNKAVIKMTNLSELDEGNDSTLDRICNHVIYNLPLYVLPDEKTNNRSIIEENNFLEHELNSIIEIQQNIKKVNLSGQTIKETPLTVINLRNSNNSHFYPMICQSRYSNIEYLEKNLTQFFFKDIYQIAKDAKGKYIYFGKDNIHIDESFFSTAIDYLEESEEGYVAWRSGVWICNKDKKICAECFTERNDTDTFEECKKIDPVFEDISTLFACFIWKTDSLIELIKNLMVIQKEYPVNISEFFFNVTISRDAVIKVVKSQVPNVTIYKLN